MRVISSVVAVAVGLSELPEGRDADVSGRDGMTGRDSLVHREDTRSHGVLGGLGRRSMRVRAVVDPSACCARPPSIRTVSMKAPTITSSSTNPTIIAAVSDMFIIGGTSLARPER